MTYFIQRINFIFFCFYDSMMGIKKFLYNRNIFEFESDSNS
jgi:hypothetical protein